MGETAKPSYLFSTHSGGSLIDQLPARKTINPELHLTHGDRALLVAITSMSGFAILQSIMRAEVDKFVVKLINSDASKQDEVIANHYLAKAAAQFYQAVVGRINEETLQYTSAPRATDRPVDVTEILDMDAIRTLSESVPNLLGGDEND